MNKTEAMKRLKAAGTAQNRKVYARHGVSQKMFGVSCADLSKLQKTIKTDHTLAESLWKSGNHDARILATMIADPDAMTPSTFAAWAKDLDNYGMTDALAGLAVRSPHGLSCMKKWIRTNSEWTGAAGWGVLAGLVETHDGLSEKDLREYLETIETTISHRPNRVRHSMNMALICIALRSPALQTAAIAAAKRIGKVHVDHGQTGCKTPEAIPYIKRTVDHRRAMAARRRTKAARASTRTRAR